MQKEGVIIGVTLVVIALIGLFLLPSHSPSGYSPISQIISADKSANVQINAVKPIMLKQESSLEKPKIAQKIVQDIPQNNPPILSIDTATELQVIKPDLNDEEHLPDLVITNAVFKQRGNLVPDDSLAVDIPVDIILTLTNAGNAPVPNEGFDLEYELDNKNQGWLDMKTSLEPGQSIEVRGGPTLWLKKGTHELTVYLDRTSYELAKNNRIKELNEENNKWKKTLVAKKFKNVQRVNCNANDVCESEESILSCPHDCMPKEKYLFCKSARKITAVQELDKVKEENILVRKLELERKAILMERNGETLEGRAGHIATFSDGTRIFVADVTLPQGTTIVLALLCIA